MSSIPLLDAASISIRSGKFPLSIERQFSHSPQGSPSLLKLRQLSALVSSLATVVLPVPLGPANIYAEETLLSLMALRSTFFTGSCPTRSRKNLGLYFLAKGTYIRLNFNP